MEEKIIKHLTLEDRREIEYCLKIGMSKRRIALRLGKTPTCISNEINRNKRRRSGSAEEKGAYSAELAHDKAKKRRATASFRGKKILENKQLHAFIDNALLDLQSPEAISGRLATGIEKLPYVSRSTIESYLYSVWGESIRVEIGKVKKSYRRKNKTQEITTLTDRIFIDERPEIIKDRGRIGDLELDFIVSGKSGKGYLVTAIDRKARKSFVRKLYPVTFENLISIVLEIKQEFPDLKSITTDNDILLKQHNRLHEILEVPIYFCHPYSSWEKGSVENLNRFIRKFIRKGSDLHLYTKGQIKRIETLANNRFMKILGYLTPNEVYMREGGMVGGV